MTPEKRFKLNLFFRVQLWEYALVIFCICLCSYLFDKWLEGIAFCIAHCYIRYKMKYVYHSVNYCMLITLFIVWCCIPSIIGVNLSLLASIPIAIFVCWVGNKAEESKVFKRDNAKLNDENCELKELLKPKPFNVEKCSMAELLKRCHEVNLSERNTELAIEFFIYKTKQSILADRLCIDEKSVQMRKQRLKEKLNRN